MNQPLWACRWRDDPGGSQAVSALISTAAASVATYSHGVPVAAWLVAQLVRRYLDRSSFRDATRSRIEIQGRLPAVVQFRCARSMTLCSTRPLLAAMTVKE